MAILKAPAARLLTESRTPLSGDQATFRNWIGAAYDDLYGKLRNWANSESYTLTTGWRNSDDLLASGRVVWPDLYSGYFTATQFNSDPPAINAYTVTYVSPTGSPITITQPTMTRNANGAVISQPNFSFS